MKRSLLIFIVIAGSLIALIFYLSYRTSSKYSWDEHYYFKSKDPYGTLFTRQLLEDYNKPNEFKILKTEFSEVFDTNSTSNKFTYVFIGDEFYCSEDDRKILFKCIKKGATAFISANDFNAYDWGLFNCYATLPFWDSTAVLSFHDSLANRSNSYAVNYKYNDNNANKSWKYLNITDTCVIENPFTELGYGRGHGFLNFISVEYGKGRLFLHSSPITFTNIQLKKKKIKEYDEILLSHLPKHDIYWDEYHKIARTDYFEDQKLSGPLQFILSQTQLRWAWYVLLIGSLIYVLFKSKRKQRVIPVLHEKQNTSLEFVKTIGKLYQLEGDHKKIVKRKMDLFLTFIRDRFNISTSLIDDQLIEKLRLKSGVEKSKVQGIFDLYFEIIKSQKISDKTLLTFDSRMQQFYRDLKI